MDINRFTELLESYLLNRADEDEQQELFLMVASGKYDGQVKGRIDASFSEDVLSEMDAAKARQILEQIIAIKPAKLVPLYKRNVFKWVAAASVILIASLIIMNVSKSDHGRNKAVAQTPADISAPANTRAVITLSDGSKVFLDSSMNGTIAQQNSVSVLKNGKG